MKFRLKAALLFAAGLLSGCAAGLSPGTKTYLESMAPVQVPNVPLYVQEELQCGPASLAMVLTWAGTKTRPHTLTPQIYSPARQGTLQPLLISAARHHNHAAYEIRGLDTLLAEVSAGHPVIVLENLGLSWAPRWHYSVVTGVLPTEQRLVLHTGQSQPETVSMGRFLRTWGRSGSWGLLVLPPARLPASLPSLETLSGLAALESARKYPAAEKGYSAAIERWPDSLEAHIGLGNVRYAQGDFKGAVQTLEAASTLHPQSGIAWNNLANARLALGQRKAALEAAQKAVSIGGPFSAEFQATLDDIRSASDQ